MSQAYLNIKNYIFKKDIGEGNFGKVKLGIFQPTGEEFAIKILNKNKIRIKMKKTIFKENEIITKFNHINVVYVFQIIEDTENYYIIMEYCKHGELFDYIVKNEKLSEDESSVFFYQLINGIEYIHSKGISHRDLKPENLLLAENNILKIIDFGLSHEFGGEELLKTKCGSPSYAAPEIICCPFYDGFKVDIWCCGIILYAMLCGYLPFDGENNNVLFQNILNCQIEFPEFLSEMSKDIISKILNPIPDDRITIKRIKEHKFYLKGKELCKIDYDNIEQCIIKRRNIFADKKNNQHENKSSTNIHNPNKIQNNTKYYLTINNEELNKINLINKNYINALKGNNSKKMKDNSPSMNRAKKILGKKRINIRPNKIHNILTTEINELKKFSSRAFSSSKDIKNNHKLNQFVNGIIRTSLNNSNSERKKQLHTKADNYFFEKILKINKIEHKKSYQKNDNNVKTNRIFFNTIKQKTINKRNSKKNIHNNIMNKNMFLNNYVTSNLVSLSNENNSDIFKKHQKTCAYKMNKKYNLFKGGTKSFKDNKYLEKGRVVKKNSKSQKKIKNINDIRNNCKYINLLNDKKSKYMNCYGTNPTLYYNNININIREININQQKDIYTPNHKFQKWHKIQSFSNSKTEKNKKTSKKRNYIQNKALSSKRLFTHKININNIHNLKSNINSNNNKNDINDINSLMNSKKGSNVNTINNEYYTNRNFYALTYYNIKNNINQNNKNPNKNLILKNNDYRLKTSNNIRPSYSEKKFNILKKQNILTTEPKDFVKKNCNTKNKHTKEKVGEKNISKGKYGKKTEYRTIHTENRINSVSKLNKKYSHKNIRFNQLYKPDSKKSIRNSYKVNDILLHMFMEPKTFNNNFGKKK